jgi:hypothetical protein
MFSFLGCFWACCKANNSTANFDKESFVLPKIYGLELRIRIEKHILKLPVFTPNLSQFSQSILIILIDSKLASTVYFKKIYSLSILSIQVFFEL